jgi:hypothetical protein
MRGSPSVVTYPELSSGSAANANKNHYQCWVNVAQCEWRNAGIIHGRMTGWVGTKGISDEAWQARYGAMVARGMAHSHSGDGRRGSAHRGMRGSGHCGECVLRSTGRRREPCPVLDRPTSVPGRQIRAVCVRADLRQSRHVVHHADDRPGGSGRRMHERPRPHRPGRDELVGSESTGLDGEDPSAAMGPTLT